MIYSQTQNLFFYTPDQTTYLVYPQIFFPVTLQNSNSSVTGNIQNQIQQDLKIKKQPVVKEISPLNKARNKKISKIEKNHLNIKNITPNLVRKLFGFLLSQRCKVLMQNIDTSISKIEISRVLTFVQSIKNTIGTYIGKRNLRKLWYKDSKVAKSCKTYQLIRRMSRYYLQIECPNSIILSKRIKSQLKSVHLKYRRKLLKMLNQSSKLQK